jgi:predicted nucleic acid-binding Zn ribbon protein
MGKVISGRSSEGRAIIAKKKRRKALIKMFLLGFFVFVISTVILIALLNIFGLWRF